MDSNKIFSYTKAFGKFWYNFIIGEDWILAATACVGVIIDFILRGNHITAWYILPILLTIAMGISIMRKH